MKPVIQLLDDTSINQIAAGEVIERPASVVKELVENSLDAGARRIEVEIEAGGVGKIRVSDDGCGMSEADVRLAVLRHATSKIRSADELVTVSSLGFRGEALPSIASVSRFSLFSRQIDAELGTRIDLEGGQVLSVEECGSEIGTMVLVRELFYNTPVRLKFMKTAAAESSHVHEAIVRQALSRPEVSFRLVNNGRTTLHTPGTGRLADVLLALYGPDTVREMFAVDYTDEDAKVHIYGYAAKPTLRKGSRQWQSFSVNRRVIGSRMLNRAVDTAYQTLLPQGAYPLVALQIEIPPERVDVNVHPQKAEVKFQDDRVVFRAIQAALKSQLISPESPAEVAAAFQPVQYQPRIQPAYVQETLPMHSTSESWPRDSVSAARAVTEDVRLNVAPCKPGQSADEFSVAETDAEAEAPAQKQEPVVAGRWLQALAQYSRCYILATDGDSLYIVDQHAAHERILFDLLARRQNPSSFQTLLVPMVLDLDPMEVNAAETYTAELAGLGFNYDWLGPSSIRIAELPVHIPQAEAVTLLRQILSSALALKVPDAESFRQLWIETAACHMAIRAGQSLNQPQMQALLDELGNSERPYTCPHGRPTVVRFTTTDLARLFKRV